VKSVLGVDIIISVRKMITIGFILMEEQGMRRKSLCGKRWFYRWVLRISIKSVIGFDCTDNSKLIIKQKASKETL